MLIDNPIADRFEVELPLLDILPLELVIDPLLVAHQLRLDRGNRPVALLEEVPPLQHVVPALATAGGGVLERIPELGDLLLGLLHDGHVPLDLLDQELDLALPAA